MLSYFFHIQLTIGKLNTTDTWSNLNLGGNSIITTTISLVKRTKKRKRSAGAKVKVGR